ncbi:MAG: hypothetical protein EOO17_00910 [Chloroflexi bacterium]|nr:MAG: hypothetical protein EOO17_00910 [Chloroflexota bacterium]
MGFFIFLLIIIAVIVIWKKTSGNSSGEGDGFDYAKGYWDGYRAFGEKLQDHIAAGNTDDNSLRKLIDEGVSGPGAGHHTPDGQVNETVEQGLQEAAPTANADARSAAPLAVGRSQQQIIEDDERRSIRNMNALLYMASFLLVAAGAAFIAAAVPDTAKVFGLWLIVLAFYGVGLYLHNSQPKLRPAAVAFTGTGLALLPFAGIALDQYTAIGAAAAWLLTSVVGLVAYAVAALRLQNQVVSYLTLAFVLSLASSGVATAALPIMWYFVVIIGVSLLANVIATLNPDWLPKIFAEPVERTGQIVTPFALLASLALFDRLSVTDYQIVFSVATAHYLVVWIQTRLYLFESIARSLLHITVLLIAWDVVNGDGVQFGIVFLIAATLQAVYSLISVAITSDRKANESLWLAVALVLQFVSMAFWSPSEQVYQLAVMNLITVLVTSLVSAVYIRRSVFGSAGLVALAILPFIVGRDIIMPPLDWGWIVAYFIAVASTLLGLYYAWARRHSTEAQGFVSVGFISFLTIAGIIGVMLDSAGQSITFSILTVLLFAASYMLKQTALTAVAAGTLVVAVWAGMVTADVSSMWLAVVTGLISAGMVYAYQWLTVAESDTERQKILLYGTWIILGVTAITHLFASDIAVRTTAALIIVIAALTVAAEAYRRKDAQYGEVAAYVATFGMQRLVAVAWPELNLVFYAHWWAITVVVIAYLRHELIPRAVIAMGVITTITASYALLYGEGYSLLFLVEHLALLIAGFVYGKSWAVWWGVVAASAAVLYFLRDIAFLAFAFLGILLIGIVIWRLSKSNKAE